MKEHKHPPTFSFWIHEKIYLPLFFFYTLAKQASTYSINQATC